MDNAPEYESVESFVEFCMEDDRDTFSHEDLGELAFRLRRSRSKLRAELESYGLKLAERAKERHVRGFTTSSHDRWYGPGASPTHGGTGWEQINGFAGQEG